MAYRASTKLSTKKATAEEKPTADTTEQSEPTAPAAPEKPEPKARESKREATLAPSESLSIDDIIGGPVNRPADDAPEAPEPAAPSADDASAFTGNPVDQQPQQQQPRESHGGPRDFQPHQRMGGGNPRSGGYRDNRGGNRFGGGGRGRQGGGYGGYQSGGGGYRDNRGGAGGGFRRPFQRDFSYVPAPNTAEPQFTPDANVPTETVTGILDMMPEGHGFLRPKFTPSDRDVYISQSQIRRFLLRNGDEVEGQARPPKENERYWGLLKVEKINTVVAEEAASRPRFEDQTPIYPNVHIKLETGQSPLSTRIIDLLAPIGFGQRGLIVSPPKAGKTTILKEIAAGISANYPDVHLMAALIGERPEEVTDLSRSIKGEVLASNFDQSPAEQTRVAEIALDRAKRLVEMGKDVVVLLDSITRLARAYNLVVNPSGRTLSGGFDPAALYPAKKFLGAARCVEAPEGSEKQTNGSLTVIGTALVDTGSRMDDMIYEEFKGTGNMELHLSRKLQERRVFPAIDIPTSGTRHDELLLGEDAMKFVTTLRHMLALLSEDEQSAMMIDRLSKTASNAEFLESLSKG
jgi:transcription termination factor Rho